MGAVPALILALQDPEPKVRVAVVGALEAGWKQES